MTRCRRRAESACRPCRIAVVRGLVWSPATPSSTRKPPGPRSPKPPPTNPSPPRRPQRHPADQTAPPTPRWGRFHFRRTRTINDANIRTVNDGPQSDRTDRAYWRHRAYRCDRAYRPDRAAGHRRNRWLSGSPRHPGHPGHPRNHRHYRHYRHSRQHRASRSEERRRTNLRPCLVQIGHLMATDPQRTASPPRRPCAEPTPPPSVTCLVRVA